MIQQASTIIGSGDGSDFDRLVAMPLSALPQQCITHLQNLRAPKIHRVRDTTDANREEG